MTYGNNSKINYNYWGYLLGIPEDGITISNDITKVYYNFLQSNNIQKLLKELTPLNHYLPSLFYDYNIQNLYLIYVGFEDKDHTFMFYPEGFCNLFYK